MFRPASICVLTVALFALPASSEGALFEATYVGEVGGAIDAPVALQAFPVGTPISFTLTFDDFFMSDSDVVFSPPRPVTGSVDVGGVVYQLTSHQIDVATVDFNTHEVLAANYHFVGTGPAVDGLEFIGLFVRLTSSLELKTGNPFGSVALGWHVQGTALNEYLQSNEQTQQFSVEPLDVPAAPLGWMTFAGVGAAVGRSIRAARRRTGH